VFPWKNASDIAYPMVDIYINEDVAIDMQALNRAKMKCTPVETNDNRKANLHTDFLRWMLFSQMDERDREARLMANYGKEDGKAVMQIMWERAVEMTRQELTMEEIKSLAEEARGQMAKVSGQGGSRLATGDTADYQSALQGGGAGVAEVLVQLPGMIMDPGMDEMTAELIQGIASELVKRTIKQELADDYLAVLEDYELKSKAARRAVRELREDGKTSLPVPALKMNRPQLTARRLGEDIWFSDDGNVEQQRFIFVAEWMNPVDLRQRALTGGWDEEWVDYVIAHGKGMDSSAGGTSSVSRSAVEHGSGIVNTEDQIRVLHVFARRLSEDGIPGIYCTVVHPCTGGGGSAQTGAIGTSRPTDCPEFGYAPTVLNYKHGQYPFVLHRREFLSRRLDDSRGYGEIGSTWQNTAKCEIDMVIDRGTLTLNPPLHHPKGRPPSKWGPGVKVPGSKSEYQWADTPEGDALAMQGTERVERLAKRYFGRVVDEADVAIAGVVTQDRIDNWLSDWKRIATMVLQLCQQFQPDEFFYRVVGTQQGGPIRATRVEIQGKFDLALTFDARDINPEEVKGKIDLLKEIISTLDVNGLVDRDELMKVVFEWFDPILGERILRPGENASQHEIEDEQTVFARIWAGIDQDIKPGQAYQLRLQVLNDIIAGRDEEGQPKNAEAIKRYQADEAFKGRVDKRLQQLNHQLEQRRNAVIGRLGA
jgi:hypothetical protein